MDENNSNSSATAAAAASAAQQQQLLLQQQLFIMQQQQQQQQQQQHQQQQQQNQRPRSQIQQPQLQQAMSRFPSNIDAHLRPRSFQFNQNQSQNQMQMQQGQQQMMRSTNQSPIARNPEVEMALQDAFKVCNPDVRTPFTSIEDAVNRLLPYHVVSDYEAEEDDKILETDKTGQVPSRLQQWDHNILVKIAEFTSTFEKQVLAFNIMTRKRSLGEFRSEERLLLEQALIQEERRAAMEAKMEMESREKAARMTSSSTPSLVHQDFPTPGPPRTAAIRSHAVATQADDAQDHGAPWVNNNNNNENSNENEEGEEDFLNGEDDNDDDEEFDLNER